MNRLSKMDLSSRTSPARARTTSVIEVVLARAGDVVFPIPTPQRCWDMGVLLRKLIEEYPTDERVVLIGTGGLSHQLQGARAGFLNPEADRKWLGTFASEPDYRRSLSREEYVEMFGSEGAELIMWLMMRAA